MTVNKDNAVKFGCGRYIQERNAIENNLLRELKRFGTKALFICGKNGVRVAGGSIEKALLNSDFPYEISVFCSTPCYENADEYVEHIKKNNFDIVCGVGGGVIGDTAKLVAARAGVKLIQIPTSSATCVSVTPLSVLYDRNTHAHICDLKLMTEADAVIVDLDILINQPKRLFWAGVTDSMAKAVEINHRLSIRNEEEYPMGASISFQMAKLIYDFYSNKFDLLDKALSEKTITKDFEIAVFYIIAVTGIIQGIAGGSSAIAHRFHEQARTFFYNETKDYLHGEIVGMGMIVQRAFNGLDYNSVIALLKKMQIPVTLPEINITDTDTALDIFVNEMCKTAIIGSSGKETEENVRKAFLKICG